MPAPATRKPWWRRLRHAAVRTLRSVTRLEDTPYRIAMGSACGLFTCPLPMFGQMLLAMGLARVLRANVVASMPWTWITNPLTTFPIWYGCYLVGEAVLLREPVRFAVIRGLFTQMDEIGLVATVRQGGSVLLGILPPLWIGTCLVGLLLGSAGYIAIRSLVILVQARRRMRAAHWRHAGND